jgi:lysophospholipase L1-like esterase
VASKYGLQLADLHTLFGNGEDTILSDGIHPNEKGARRMAEILEAEVKK